MISNTDKQMLVAGPSWVGDMVMAQSLFKVLRDSDAGMQIDVIAPPWSLGILDRMPEVRAAYALDVGHGELGIGTRRKLADTLRSVGYDRAIVLPRSLKSALVPWLAGIPQRTGFRGEWRYGLLTDVRKLDKRRYDQTVKRFVALGLPPDSELPDIPAPRLDIDEQNQQRLVAELGLRPAAGIAFMPGAAYGPAKMWPLDHYRELATRLTAAGWQVWVMGSGNETPLAQEIAADNPNVLNLCGKTTLDATVDVFALAAAAVTNDSGLMHVAAAAGTHIAALYGSSSPEFTPPLTTDKTIHHLNLDCSPCHKRTCPLGHLNCLRQITPETVFRSLQPALQN